MLVSRKRIKVALFLRNFQLGGTERQVFELARHLDKDKYDVCLIALGADGPLRESCEVLPGVRVLIIGAARLPATTVLKLVKVCRQFRVDVLHSFGSVTNAYAIAAKLAFPRLRVVVGLRNALEDPCFGYASLRERAKIRVLDLALKSFGARADLFISNSQAAKIMYTRRFGSKVTVIPNGIDVDKFRPDPDAQVILRRAICASQGARIIGIVANFSAYKDYPTFIRAARLVADNIENVHFVAIGNDRNSVGLSSKDLVKALSLQSIFHFFGPCTEVQNLMAGFDVLCSSSATEGFSNSIAEAMSCGVPCVATDVGDSGQIVGDTGFVVAPSDPQSLAAGLTNALRMPALDLRRLGWSARDRVLRNYSTSQMIARHQYVYESLLSNTLPVGSLDAPAATWPTVGLDIPK